MAETTIKIEGMSCQHCVMRIKKAIDALSGVSQSDVQVGSAAVKFDESRVKKEDIAAAIEKAGYKIIG
ncbi:MAG: copper ion binding protein [Nitrospirae bacterium]|nr:copper ion binding protein [Nitrospirota bacterium]MCL5978424.1 copper ion binding protein [Nitrospirota bacterium]